MSVYDLDMRLISILALCWFSTAAHADENWTVNRNQAKCLFEHLPRYLESGDEPIVIFLSVCPTVDRMEALAKLQQNNGALPAGPSIIITPEGEERPVDDVIVYTKAELECLLNIELQNFEGFVLLPLEPCGS